MMQDVALVERAPTPDEYRSLRAAVGWSDVDPEVAAKALGAEVFAVCLVRGSETIGCGRVIGDGGIHQQIEDVIVHPSCQGQGLGARIMDRIVEWLSANVPSGRSVTLLAAEGTAGFYGRYGFQVRPADAPAMTWRHP